MVMRVSPGLARLVPKDEHAGGGVAGFHAFDAAAGIGAMASRMQLVAQQRVQARGSFHAHLPALEGGDGKGPHDDLIAVQPAHRPLDAGEQAAEVELHADLRQLTRGFFLRSLWHGRQVKDLCAHATTPAAAGRAALFARVRWVWASAPATLYSSSKLSICSVRSLPPEWRLAMPSA